MTRWHRDEAQKQSRPRHAAEDAKNGDKGRGGARGEAQLQLQQLLSTNECRNKMIDRVARYVSVRLALTQTFACISLSFVLLRPRSRYTCPS